MNPPLPPHSPRLSPLLIQLLRGVIDRDEQPALWQDLLQHQSAATEYFRLIGLELRLDEAEGYAFLKQFLVDEEGTPRLIQRRPLGYLVSLLCALLRKRMVESDAAGGPTRIVVTREQMISMMRLFLPEQVNEARTDEQIDAQIHKAMDLGFLKPLKTDPPAFEIRRLIKALVDADWLIELDEKLKAYKDYGNTIT